MRVGLLLCDHVRPEFQDTFGDYDHMFRQVFPSLNWQYYEVTQGRFPQDIDECDIYFSTGSHQSVYENEPWIAQVKTFIRDLYRADKYFIGVCFGHQLLGEALGGKVEKSPQGWCVGVHEFEIVQQEKWMAPEQESFRLLMSCQDQIANLPEGAVVLASSEKCPVGMFRVGEKMLGIQGHPEFPKGYSLALMEQRVARIGEEEVEKGKESLVLELDVDLLKEWIFAFVK